MYLVKRGNKYNAKSTIYNGIIYHSKKEAGFARTLDSLKKSKDPRERVVSWERQVKISLDVNGEHIANYYVDFRAQMATGITRLYEVKGFTTEIFRLKLKLMEATYLKENPDIEYQIIR